MKRNQFWHEIVHGKSICPAYVHVKYSIFSSGLHQIRGRASTLNKLDQSISISGNGAKARLKFSHQERRKKDRMTSTLKNQNNQGKYESNKITLNQGRLVTKEKQTKNRKKTDTAHNCTPYNRLRRDAVSKTGKLYITGNEFPWFIMSTQSASTFAMNIAQ
jgi:hypothetical protein